MCGAKDEWSAGNAKTQEKKEPCQGLEARQLSGAKAEERRERQRQGLGSSIKGKVCPGPSVPGRLKAKRAGGGGGIPI